MPPCVIESTCGGMAGVSGPLQLTACGETEVAPAVFWKWRLFSVCTERLTAAADGARLLAVALQWEIAETAIVVAEQLWVRVTAPWCLLKATGMVTALPELGVRVMRPKYWPSAAKGALTAIENVTCSPAATLKLSLVLPLTVIMPLAGCWMETVSFLSLIHI